MLYGKRIRLANLQRAAPPRAARRLLEPVTPFNVKLADKQVGQMKSQAGVHAWVGCRHAHHEHLPHRRVMTETSAGVGPHDWDADLDRIGVT